MIQYEGIDRNFQFLVLEVRKQIETTARLLQSSDPSLLRTILSRDNYTDTLRSLLEKKCISYFRHTPSIDRSSANLVIAVNTVAINLERIADFCVNIATQVGKLNDGGYTSRFDYSQYTTELLEALPQLEPALTASDASQALRLCWVEDRLDQLYEKDYETIRDALRLGRDTDDLLRCLAIAHYLERMGDSILNIGEAVLFACTGERLKLHEYNRLRETIGEGGSNTPLLGVEVDFNWETQSGCRIAKVHKKPQEGYELEAIFKKGHADKLQKERENIERWERVFPGLPPHILDFREGSEDAALLLQFLDGYTLRDLVLTGEQEVVDQAMSTLENMLRTLWTATRRDEPVCAQFIAQTKRRIDDVFRLHPEFANACYEIGSQSFMSLEKLLEAGETAEKLLESPFRVLIHGDFNADNIIYDQRQHRVHLIDLYRSTESDYVQDVSILLVSHFRCPVFDSAARDRINDVSLRFCKFAAEFAWLQGDQTFSARLALGLARAFITSTRFEAEAEFARAMYSRAVYLLEKVITWSKTPDRVFQLNEDILMY